MKIKAFRNKSKRLNNKKINSLNLKILKTNPLLQQLAS